MSACCTLVDIRAIFASSIKTCIANALERAISVYTQNAINFRTIMLSTITFVYIFAGTSVAFIAILTAAVITLLCVDTGGARFVAAVKALLAFIGEFTRFNSISVIPLFTSTFVSTWYVNAFTVPMTAFISLL